VKQHDTERKEDTAQAKKNYVVQIVIAIAVAVYAFLTFWQGWLLRKSINNNTEQFRIDQRPYIWVGKLKPIISTNERLRADVVFVNFGKTPAIKRGGYGKIFWGKDAMEQSDKWFASLDTAPPIERIAIVPPGVPPDIDKNAFDWTSIFSDSVLSKSNADRLLRCHSFANRIHGYCG
jgi:hypothetical protein